jgi:polyphosphate kinase
MIEHLYAASAAGVSIDLLVRGICCLRPGVPGLSENIRVRSLIGRYLEHSRILQFANGAGPGSPVTYIGSADLMPRNLDRRIEAMVPVVDPHLQRRVDEILAVEMADDVLAWTLGPDATWTKVVPSPGSEPINAHLRFQELALARARRTDVDA